MRRPHVTRNVVVLLSSLAAIAVVTGLLRTVPDVSPTIAALALLLVVLGSATLARVGIALIASVAAMLTLNFFFLPPVGTFTIADPQNWIALFSFLATSLIASRLSAKAKARALEAIERQQDVERLYSFSRAILLI